MRIDESAIIEDLRGQLEADPTSQVFAALAEECRRAGQLEEAIEISRTGLGIHPDCLSARVTLGRALSDRDELDEARTEFEAVLSEVEDDVGALRGLAEIHRRHGDMIAALHLYRRALALEQHEPYAGLDGIGAVGADQPPEARVLARLEQFLAAVQRAREARQSPA